MNLKGAPMNRVHSKTVKALKERQRAEQRFALGLCVLCADRPHAEFRRCCSVCLEKNKAHNRRRRESVTVPEASTAGVGASL